jgi:hypothetical protein
MGLGHFFAMRSGDEKALFVLTHRLPETLERAKIPKDNP